MAKSAEDRLCDILLSMNGRHSIPEIFKDWVTMSAMAISNASTLIHDEIWKEREETYLYITQKYGAEDTKKMIEMFAFLAEALEEKPSDVLGYVFMKTGYTSAANGQFFTPYHLSELVAKIGTDGEQELSDGDIVRLAEPASGSGGLIIAAAMSLKEKGIDYQRRLEVVAQDLDWQCVYMCYVQLSLLGIRAVCVQGSTLTDPFDPERTTRGKILITPAKAGVLI